MAALWHPHSLIRSRVSLLLIVLLTIQNVRSRSFVFSASTRISQLSNWLNQDYPCQGDTIIFEENKKTVTFIDESIQKSSALLKAKVGLSKEVLRRLKLRIEMRSRTTVEKKLRKTIDKAVNKILFPTCNEGGRLGEEVSSMVLPHVGSIIFSDNAVLGEKSKWQCTRRKSPEKVFFQSDAVFPAFSDPASWLPEDKPLLHLNMVPGPKDDVIFHDMGAFQISIDDQVTVNTLKMSKDWVSLNNG